MANCLRLGMHVRTRGEVHVKRLNAGFELMALEGDVVEFGDRGVRVVVFPESNPYGAWFGHADVEEVATNG